MKGGDWAVETLGAYFAYVRRSLYYSSLYWADNTA